MEDEDITYNLQCTVPPEIYLCEHTQPLKPRELLLPDERDNLSPCSQSGLTKIGEGTILVRIDTNLQLPARNLHAGTFMVEQTDKE